MPVGFCGIYHLGNKVYVVGRYEGATDFYSSADGGATWQYHDMSALALGLVDVAFVSDSVGFISGTSRSGTLVPGPPTILKTTDGGQTWRTVFIDGTANGWAWKIFPAAPGVLYVSLETDDGLYRVAKSTDGGDSWRSQTVATNQPLGLSTNAGIQGIGFLDANVVGWVGGFLPRHVCDDQWRRDLDVRSGGECQYQPVPPSGDDVVHGRHEGCAAVRRAALAMAWRGLPSGGGAMKASTALYLVLMAAVIVAVDVLFFKDRFLGAAGGQASASCWCSEPFTSDS